MQHFTSIPSSSTSTLPPQGKKRKNPTPTPPPDYKNSNNNITSSNNHVPTKRLPSCDLCRARKVKCVKSEAGGERCEGCVGLDQKCEYTHERRKPGPVNSFARKASSERPYPQPTTASIPQPTLSQPPLPPIPTTSTSHLRTHSNSTASIHPSSLHNPEPPLFFQPDPALPSHTHSHSDPYPPGPSFTQPPTQTISTHSQAAFNPFTLSDTLNPSPEQSAFPWLPISPASNSHYINPELDAESFGDHSPQNGLWPWNWDTGESNPVPSAGSTGGTGVEFGGTGLGVTDGIGVGVGVGGGAGKASGVAGRSQSFGNGDEKGNGGANTGRRLSLMPRGPVGMGGVSGRLKRIEDVVEWSVLMRILQAWYKHMYPLLPIVHWPTFSQQLLARLDERSEPWRAFLFSLLAYAIIQLPRSALAFLPVTELRKLHQRCHVESGRLQNRKFKEVTLLVIATIYCDHIYLGTLGRTNAANVELAKAIELAHTMGLHDDRLGGEVDCVEREMRGRVFWLLYDTLLTPSGRFPQPANTTPLLAGFFFNVRLFRLLGEVLTSHRLLPPSHNPYTHLSLLPRYHPPRASKEYFEELERMLEDLPGPLKLVNPVYDHHGVSRGSGTGGYGVGGDEAGFGTCRANILVTQAMVRFAIRQYGRAAGEVEEEEAGENGVKEEDMRRGWAEKDVLGLLEAMSPESLAANGDSLRNKVLFLAGNLLEKCQKEGGEASDGDVGEGYNYVADFLAVYTRISEEQNADVIAIGESVAVTRANSLDPE